MFDYFYFFFILGLIRETCETNSFGLGELNVEDLTAFSMIAESGYDSVVIETLLPVAPAGTK